jgi:hypothetical protein
MRLSAFYSPGVWHVRFWRWWDSHSPSSIVPRVDKSSIRCWACVRVGLVLRLDGRTLAKCHTALPTASIGEGGGADHARGCRIWPLGCVARSGGCSPHPGVVAERCSGALVGSAVGACFGRAGGQYSVQGGSLYRY